MSKQDYPRIARFALVELVLMASIVSIIVALTFETCDRGNHDRGSGSYSAGSHKASDGD